MQKLIELAKNQAEETDYYLRTLIEFSDNYVNDIDPQFMVNQTVMTSKKQEDLYILAHEFKEMAVYTIEWGEFST
ncbi:hypothetical protein [Paenibacillus sp. 7516]|uniref:hypothetical protein n=1 Tax=Paenibacillus sp. 7516 TaxID=2022549 RepID=UPI000BA73874|nr:hypothetical protein [Paenibacillus sp. 7516]PAF32684.1 hypothetical protein CHI14_04775 [Paenibacillus sp. 7516]